MKLLATIQPLAVGLSNQAFATEDDTTEFGATSVDLTDDTSATENAAPYLSRRGHSSRLVADTLVNTPSSLRSGIINQDGQHEWTRYEP